MKEEVLKTKKEDNLNNIAGENSESKDKFEDMEIPVDTLSERTKGSVSQRIECSELDKILGKQISVLDKGFIRLIDYMGDDSSITQAARISYGSGTKTKLQDAGLIDFLLRHKHTSPFEMCEIKLHVKAPIFIARQWLRHRTANVNELSARYSVINNEIYIPNKENLKTQSKVAKQGRDKNLTPDEAQNILDQMSENTNNTFEVYNSFIDKNITRELSRLILPQGTYTEFYWKIDLHNLLHFVSLRTKPGAQYEIRAYANVMLHDIIQKWVPLTYKSFVNHQYNGVNISSNNLESLKKMLDPKKAVEFIDENPSPKGETREFVQFLKTLISE